MLQKHMHQNGVICVLADGHLEPYTLLPEFHSKELTIIGSSDGWDYQQHATWFFGSDQKTLGKLESLFDLLINANELSSTFKKLANQEIDPIKILVDFH
jgi:alcohol dehydrogenase